MKNRGLSWGSVTLDTDISRGVARGAPAKKRLRHLAAVRCPGNGFICYQKRSLNEPSTNEQHLATDRLVELVEIKALLLYSNSAFFRVP